MINISEKIKSEIPDNKINAQNVLLEISIKDYLSFAGDIIKKNEYQRKRVIASNISKQLKSDLLIGCTIPPIVLAVQTNEQSKSSLSSDKVIEQAIEDRSMIILDGLQRTHVLRDIEEEFKSKISKLEKEDKPTKEESIKYKDFLSKLIRVEIYVGIERLGVLYRMLTLNTGQTTMSTRHLLEILYLDYLDESSKEISFLRDVDEESISTATNEYKFKDAIDCFISYIEREEVPIKRAEVLDNIDNINNLSDEKFNQNVFYNLILTYKKLLDELISKSNDKNLNDDEFVAEYKLNSRPFGRDIVQIFKKSQSMTGFGAAVGHLKKIRFISLDDIVKNISSINFSEDSGSDLRLLIKHLDIIRDKSKKVGNDQRFYFRNLFTALFDSERASYLKLNEAIRFGYKRVTEDRLYSLEDDDFLN